jgi:ribosomal-protein-alanine N-acetyltransferase
MPGARVESGERVTLRTAEEEDAAFLQRAHANPELRYSLGWDVKSRDKVAAELEDDMGYDELFLVCLDGEDAGPGQPDEDEVRRIGAVVAATPGEFRSPVGYWLVPAVHGEGYATGAVSLALDHVFRVAAHPAVAAKAMPDNDASRGVLESLGFTQEGRLRKEVFWDGEYRDSVYYSLLREEWRDRE